MCGIAASFNALGTATPLDLALIRHRGPDSSGEWTSPDARLWLGNTRLAIMDLSPHGAQPMIDSSTGNVIVVNGEIYNHLALREQLGPNVCWEGTSDTETLLRGYARWGQELLERVKGMFAFVIYDHARQELFIARDRLGIKPLYYVARADGIRFASEVKLFVRPAQAITPAAVSAYLEWGACPERKLLFTEIKSLPAGHAITISTATGEMEERKYWPTNTSFVAAQRDVVKTVRGLIERAVDEHLLADVPVASFLSGGIDSSIVTAIAAQKLSTALQTFSVGFSSAEFDESTIAMEVAERYRTEHHRIELSDEEVIDSVTEAVEKLDLPSVDAINTYIVSRAVAAHGVKVALSGLGGDELFGGYASFADVPKLQHIARVPLPLRRMMRGFGNVGERLADVPNTTDAFELARWRRRFMTSRMIKHAGLPNGGTPSESTSSLIDDYARISWAELSGYMRRMLLRDSDQMSMAVSLELRVPFLDHELVQYVVGLPAAEKRRWPGTKGLLVEACRDLLPRVVYDRPKRGFVLPMKTWMRGPLASFVETGLRESVERELLPEHFVAELRSSFAGDRLHWTRLWSIVVLGQFAKRLQLSGTRHEDTPVHAFS